MVYMHVIYVVTCQLESKHGTTCITWMSLCVHKQQARIRYSLVPYITQGHSMSSSSLAYITLSEILIHLLSASYVKWE